MTGPRLAFVGAGMMGEALARGLIEAGWAASDLVMIDIRADRLDEVERWLKVPTSTDAARACGGADGVLLAVKPQDAPGALDQVKGAIGPAGIVSIVAGMRTRTIEERLGVSASVVRAMPNTPARVRKGVTALSPGSAVVQETRDLAEAVFSAVGPVVWLDEEQLDAVTAVSGSGPAYVFLLAEALIDAAAEAGIPRDVAETLTAATIEGAGTMLRQTGERADVLRKQVTSPGGTTEAALRVLEERRVREAFGLAVRAAFARSRELGS